jgi:hypothetical protein
VKPECSCSLVNGNKWFRKNWNYRWHPHKSASIGRKLGPSGINISLVENLSLIETAEPSGRRIVNENIDNRWHHKPWDHCTWMWRSLCRHVFEESKWHSQNYNLAVVLCRCETCLSPSGRRQIERVWERKLRRLLNPIRMKWREDWENCTLAFAYCFPDSWTQLGGIREKCRIFMRHRIRQ